MLLVKLSTILIGIVVVALIAGAGWYFFLRPEAQVANTQNELNTVLKPHELSIASFNDGLIVRASDDLTAPFADASAFDPLIADLKKSADSQSNPQSKELIELYYENAVLSKEKYLLLGRINQLSQKLEPVSDSDICSFSSEFDQLNRDYQLFYLRFNGLKLDESAYEREYATNSPISISIQEEKDLYDFMSVTQGVMDERCLI